jgi:transaldolase
MSPNQYEQLKEYTICVADTGEVEAIKKFLPQDATTNPSLIFKAASLPEYESLIDDAVKYGKGDLKTIMVRSLNLVYIIWLRAKTSIRLVYLTTP